jgi:hypothetical protein
MRNLAARQHVAQRNSRQQQPGISGFVASETVLSDQLQLNAEVQKNLKSMHHQYSKWLAQHNSRLAAHPKKHESLQLNIVDGVRVDEHLAQAHNAYLLVHHLTKKIQYELRKIRICNITVPPAAGNSMT